MKVEFNYDKSQLTSIDELTVSAELALTVFNVTGMKSGAHETEIAGA